MNATLTKIDSIIEKFMSNWSYCPIGQMVILPEGYLQNAEYREIPKILAFHILMRGRFYKIFYLDVDDSYALVEPRNEADNFLRILNKKDLLYNKHTEYCEKYINQEV